MTTPDPTRDALLTGILAHPDEDTPRLVYADWLQEHGDAHRAEFIRLQCRLAAMNDWDDDFAATDARCRRLFAEHPKWLEPLGSLADVSYLRGANPLSVFDRGFPARIFLNAGAFAESSARLSALVPLRGARFQYLKAADCATLAKCPALGRLRELEVPLTDTIPHAPAEEALRALAAIPHLSALERLTVQANLHEIEPLKELVESPRLRKLRDLELVLGLYDPLPDVDGVDRWEWPPNLRELSLERSHGCDEFAARLLRADFPRLERLSLPAGHEDCGEDIFEAVADGRLSDLTDLHVERVYAYPDVFAPVRKLDRPRLRSLRLPGLQPGFGSGVKNVTGGLFRAPWLRDLRRLELPQGNLLDDWLLAVADAPFAKTLRVLDVHSARFTPKAYRAAFGPKRRWPELRRLNLWYAQCPEGVLTALVDHPGLPKLVSLTAGAREPAPKFLARLAKSPAAARFRELDLNVKMEEATAAALLKSPHLENVDVLKVVKGTAGRTACDRLKRRFGARIAIETGR